MSTIVLDNAAIEALRAVSAGGEVRDREGNLVGFFLPSVRPEDVEQYECPLSVEELQRRSRTAVGRPLREALEELRKRA